MFHSGRIIGRAKGFFHHEFTPPNRPAARPVFSTWTLRRVQDATMLPDQRPPVKENPAGLPASATAGVLSKTTTRQGLL